MKFFLLIAIFYTIPIAFAQQQVDYWSLASIKAREVEKREPNKNRLRLINKLEKNINTPSERLIFMAAEIGEINLVKKLSSKYGYNVEDANKKNLMHYAVRSGNIDLVKLLDINGVPFDAQDNNSNSPLLSWAYNAISKEYSSVEIAQYLIARGANVYSKSFSVSDVFYLICYSGNLELIKLCLRHGAKLPEEIPLSFLERKGMVDVVSFFVAHGVKLPATINSALITAAKNSDHEMILFLLKHGADVNFVENKMTGALHAALKGDLQTVSLLLQNGASPTPLDCDGGNLLYYSLFSGNEELFRFIKSKIHFSKASIRERNLLIAATYGNNLNLVKSAIKLGFDVKQADRNHTALHVAAGQKNSIPIMEYLISLECDVNAIDSWGNTPLHQATQKGLLENVKFLIKHGADIHIADKKKSLFFESMLQDKSEDLVFFLIQNGVKTDSFSSFDKFYFAVNNCFFNLAEYWISKGISVHAKGKYGDSILTAISKNNSISNENFEKAINFLINKGIDINQRDREGKTVLWQLKGYDCKKLKILLDSGADPNLLDNAGKTVLGHYLTEGFSTIEFIEILLDSGTKVSLRDAAGKTALVYAVAGGKKEVADLLLSYGASMKETNNFKDEILLGLALHGDDDSIMEIVKQGANVNYSSEAGVTPLHFLCARKNISTSIIKFLIDQGANINTKAQNGTTPLLVACVMRNEKVVLYLLDYPVHMGAFGERQVTPLMIAAATGQMQAVIKLLAKGASIFAQDAEGRNALNYARLGKHEKIAKLLNKKMQEAARKNTSENMMTGTGFAISPQYVVTALHVVKNASSIELKFGNLDWIAGTIVAQTDALDIAIIRVPVQLSHYLPLTTKEETGAGDQVFTMGYPAIALLGDEIKYSAGVINSMSGLAGDSSLMQVSVPIQPGNSGSPLLNNNGEVIGMFTTTAALPAFVRSTGSIPQNVNWAVKAEYISLIANKKHHIGKKYYSNNKEKMQDVRNSTCLIITNRKK